MPCHGLSSRSRISRVATTTAFLVFVLSCAEFAVAQLSAISGVTITATVRGSVTVDARSIPLSLEFDPADPARNNVALPLAVTWNLNPAEVQGFQVIGYFADPARALLNEIDDVVVSSAHVLGRVDTGQFRPFRDTNDVGPAGGSLSLFHEAVSNGNARGNRSKLLEMRLDQESLPELPKGTYRGVLFIEVRHY
jgi:hypothetical protein